MDRSPVGRAMSNVNVAPISMGRTTAANAGNLLLQILRSSLKEGVTIEKSVWVATPDGELEVDFVLRWGREKIGICRSAQYGRATDGHDALVLVYGGFTSLYRFAGGNSDQALFDLVYTFMCECPSWFSRFGHLSVGRKASEEVILAASSTYDGSFQTEFLSMERMRLCVASDWVASFERVLQGSRYFAKGA